LSVRTGDEELRVRRTSVWSEKKGVKVFDVMIEVVWCIRDEDVKDVRAFTRGRGPVGWVRGGLYFVQFRGDNVNGGCW